jgi:predicted  nucleic acid-binding Zn-ribbon protein
VNKERVLQVIDNLKGSLETMDYGKWGALNVEQRNFMRALCNSWLILDEATNKQTEEIERLNKEIEEYQKALDETTSEKIDLENIIKEVREYITYWHYRNDFRINSFTTSVKEELLEILDKAGSEKNE